MGELLEIPPNGEPDRGGAVTDGTVGSRETWVLAACALGGTGSRGRGADTVASPFVAGRRCADPGRGRRGGGVVGSEVAAALCALAAALSFDFFLTRPYESLRISWTGDLTTEVLLLIVGLLVGDLAARGRYHRTSARKGRDQLVALHGVTELAAAGAVPEEVERAAAGELERLLGLRSCRFSTGEVGVTAHLEPDGRVLIGMVAWSTGDLGLPHRGVDLPVRAGGKVFGHFLLDPVPGVRVDHPSLLVAVSIADQVGAALAAARPRYPARA